MALAATELSILILWSKSQATELSAAASAVSFLVAAELVVLSWLEHTRSIRPSTIIISYLLFTALLDLPQIRTLWLLDTELSVAPVFTTAFALKCILLVFESLQKRGSFIGHAANLPPEATSGVINQSFLWWLTELFRRGFRGLLSFSDLFVLDSSMMSAGLSSKIQSSWQKRKVPERRLELPIVLCKALWWPFLSMMPPRIVLIGLTFAQPFLIQRVLSLLAEDDTHQTRNMGYGLIGATALIYLGLAICRLQYNQRVNRFTTMFRGATVSLIYQRSLAIKDGLYDEASAVTLMSTDVDRIAECLTEINECWARAVEVAIGITLLASVVGE